MKKNNVDNNGIPRIGRCTGCLSSDPNSKVRSIALMQKNESSGMMYALCTECVDNYIDFVSDNIGGCWHVGLSCFISVEAGLDAHLREEQAEALVALPEPPADECSCPCVVCLLGIEAAANCGTDLGIPDWLAHKNKTKDGEVT